MKQGLDHGNRDFAFFVFERTKHQPRRHLRSLAKTAAKWHFSPGIDAFRF